MVDSSKQMVSIRRASLDAHIRNSKASIMQSSHHRILIWLYALSGLIALSYEILWTRMLSLLFGTSIIGVVVTVGAFMLGLGLGSLLGQRHPSPSLRRELILLASIELMVAAYAFALPHTMHILQNFWLHVDDLKHWQTWQICSAFLALSLPATALGFAFPRMLRAGQAMQCSLAQLYGMNTLGGALGALLPLVLLPTIGWNHALHAVASIGIVLGCTLLLLAYRTSAQSVTHQKTQASPQALAPLLAYSGMGAAALMLEMAWTRAYGMILLRTEYVLAIILCVFLCGMGIGSILAKHLPRAKTLTYAPTLAAAASLLALTLFPYLNDWAQAYDAASLGAALSMQGLMIALCTLPITLILGAWLPLIADEHSGARFYAANSLGACVGALVAGFVLMPWLGTGGTWALASVFLMLCGTYWSQTQQHWRALAVSFLILVLWAGWMHRLPPASRLLADEFPQAHDIYHAEDAVSITHVLEKDNGQRLLLADLQRMDAASDATSVAVQRNQARLPLFIHSKPHDVLFLGLGTGITASGALPWTQVSIDAVELSQGAIDAAHTYFNKVNGNLPPRIHVIHDDARRYLMRSPKHYDVMVGDLFHPDMVGRGALLSVEQFQRAKEHLKPHGVLVQWLALNQFDVADMRIVMHSFASVFPKQAVFLDGYRMALVGFHDDMPSVSSMMQGAPQQSWGGEGGWTWLGRYWGDIAHLLPKKSYPIQSEWNPVIEYSLPHMRYQSSSLSEMLRWLLQSRIRFDDAVHTLAIPQEQRTIFKRAWVASSLNMRSQWSSLHGRPDAMRLEQLAYRANPKNRWAGFAIADAMFKSLNQYLPPHMSRQQALEKILQIRPDHEASLKAMYHLLKEAHHSVAAERYRQRLQALNPYGSID